MTHHRIYLIEQAIANRKYDLRLCKRLLLVLFILTIIVNA